MATTTFSGPIKAGSIREGADVNTGFTLMAQSAIVTMTGADAQTTTIGTVPANSQIVSIVLSVTTANDDTTASTVKVGTSADDNAFLAATSVQSTGTTFSGTMTSASADIGTSDQDIIATFNATDEDGTAGVGQATVLYIQNNNLS
jgi:hypothetical protein